MPMPSDNGLRPEILNPVAAPTNTFAEPTAGQQLSQLAGALSEVSPGLSRFSDAEFERGQQQQTQAGQNRARDLIESGKTYAQAIKEGLIDLHESPWFRLGAYETFGRVSANKYADDFGVALAKSDVAQSTNPADFDRFEGEFRKQWSAQNLGQQQNPYFQNAFGNGADQRIESARATFAEEAGKRLVSQTGDAYHAETIQTITDGIAQGEDMGTIADQIKLGMQRQIAAGFAPKLINDYTISAVTQAMMSMRRTDLADILTKYLEIKPGAFLGNTQGGQDAIRAAQEHVATVTQREFTREKAQVTFEMRQAEEGIYSALDQRMLNAPDRGNVNIDDLLEQMSTLSRKMVSKGIDVEAGSKIERLQSIANAWATFGTKDDPNTARDLNIRINTLSPGDDGYVTQRTIADAFANKQLSQKTYRELVDDLQKRDKEGGVGHFLNDDGMRLVESQIKLLVPQGFDDKGIVKPEYAFALANATAEVNDQYLRWRKEGGGGANASPSEINKKVYELTAAASHKFSGGNAATFEKTPAPTFGSGTAELKPVDPKKNLVSDTPAIRQLINEQQEVKAGRRNALSARSLEILKRNNIKNTDPDAVQKFVDDQSKLLAKP